MKKKFLKPEHLVNEFQKSENKVNFFRKFNFYLLFLKRFEKRSKSIRNFLNQIQNDLGFDLNKKDDWRNIKIYIPVVETKISIKKAIEKEESFKRWDLGQTNKEISGSETVWCLIEECIDSVFNKYIIEYKKLRRNPILFFFFF